MGIADEEIVNYKGEGSGVGVVAEEHGGGGFREAVFGEKGDKTELGQEAGLGEARDSLENITKKKRFAVGVTEERKETKFCEGGEGNGRHINADSIWRKNFNILNALRNMYIKMHQNALQKCALKMLSKNVHKQCKM